MPGRGKTTPSTTVDTVGSTPGDVEIVPTPRMNSAVSLFEALARKFSVGTCDVMVVMLFRLSCSNLSPLMTVMATGTDCSGSVRFVAVTVMTSSFSESSALAAGLAACWA